MSIHPTAVVDPGAEIGKNVTIGPHAVVERDVVVGDGCVLGPHAVVMRYTTLGEGCRVHSGAVLGDLPQDLGFKDEPSYVRVGCGCVFREHVTVHRGAKAGTTTEVGDHCFIMAHAHLAHNVKLGQRVVIANGSLLAGYVEVGDRAFISGNVAIHQFCRIGSVAMIGGATGLSKDIPPFCTTRSHSLNRVLGLNVVGMRRAGLGPEDRLAIKRAFDVMYRSGLNVGQALEKIRAENPASHVKVFADFIDQSARGICRLEVEEETEQES